jgi:hypothetical protein
MVKQSFGIGFIVLLVIVGLLESCSDTKKNDVKEFVPYTIENVKVAPKAEGISVKSLYYAPKVGDKSSYKLVQISKVERNSVQMEQSITQYYTKSILSIKPDSSIEMSVKIDSMRISEKGPDQAQPGKTVSLQFNSEDSASKGKPEYKQYYAIVGAQVQIIASKLGRIEEIIGLTPIINEILGNKKDSVPDKLKENLAQQIKTQFFQLPLQQEFQTYPETGKLDASKKWSRIDVLPMSGILTVKNTVNYTMGSIKEMNGKKIAIVDANLTAEISKSKEMPKGLQFTLNDSKFEGKGITIVDIQTGSTLYKKNEVFTMISATMKELASGIIQAVSQKIQTTVTVELLH